MQVDLWEEAWEYLSRNCECKEPSPDARNFFCTECRYMLKPNKDD